MASLEGVCQGPGAPQGVIVAPEEGPLLYPLWDQKARIDQSLEVLMCRGLRDSQLASDENTADAIIDEIAVYLLGKMCSRLPQPFQNLQPARTGKRFQLRLLKLLRFPDGHLYECPWHLSFHAHLFDGLRRPGRRSMILKGRRRGVDNGNNLPHVRQRSNGISKFANS